MSVDLSSAFAAARNRFIPLKWTLSETAADPGALAAILERCEQEGDCLIWQGCVSTRGEYPYLGKSRYAHREAYRAYHGDLEDGSLRHESHSVELHHTCNRGGDKRKRRCCNPLHLEAVTRRSHNMLHKRAVN